MRDTKRQFESRFPQFVTQALVRMWPSESRDWGKALTSELSEIESSGAAFFWLIGGIMLLFRERWRHFWRTLGRPVGVEPGGSIDSFARNYSRVPRTPVWVTALLLFASTTILLQPEVRNVLTILYRSYTHSEFEPWRWANVKRLRSIASKNSDPQLLGFLSLLSDNDAERLRLSEQAIEKDPSLTWLDYEQSLWPMNDLSQQHYLPAGRLERLQQWDPQNAVVHLLAAELISKPMRAEAFDAAVRGKASLAWEQKLTQNPQWISEMDLALSASKYDNYADQMIDLIRSVSARYGVSDPDIALSVLLRKRMVQFEVLLACTDSLMARGAAAERNANSALAIADYSRVLQFSQRMHLGNQLPIENAIARRVGEKAGQKLQSLYESTGRANEASLVAFQLAEWQKLSHRKLMRYVPLGYREAEVQSVEWSGLQINLAGLALATAIPALALSLFYVYMRRKVPVDRRGWFDFCASLCAAGAPFVVLASTLLLYFTYHPYAQFCGLFLKPGPFIPDFEQFISSAIVPHTIPNFYYLIWDPYSWWLGVTGLLFFVAALLVWRNLIRRNSPA